MPNSQAARDVIAGYRAAYKMANDYECAEIKPYGSRGGYYRFDGSRQSYRLSQLIAMMHRLETAALERLNRSDDDDKRA